MPLDRPVDRSSPSEEQTDESPRQDPATKTYRVDLTIDEIEAMLIGLLHVNVYFGLPPDPPTPGMTAKKKLEEIWSTAGDNE